MKAFRSIIYMTIFLLLGASIIEAQEIKRVLPPSFRGSGYIPKASFRTITFPVVDNKALQRQDSIKRKDFKNSFDFGITLKAGYGMYNEGTWEYLSDSSLLWRLRLKSPSSFGNFLIFDSFYIPHGARLFIYNNDQSQILEPFTSKDNKANKRYSIGPVVGNSVILEYHQPKYVKVQPQISVAAFIHTFKNIYKVHNDFNSSGACNINVLCPEGDGWCNQRRAVALIAMLNSTTNHLNGFCTGALITNERRDGKPFFLTANHCIDGQDVSDFVFIFNYQSQNCATPTTPPAATFTISGAQTIANNTNADFALLQLSARPPGGFNTFYAGWNNDNERPEVGGRGIHHPSGDIKKISVYDGSPDRETWGNPSAKTWRVQQWSDGTTEPGSSGSPLFNPEGLIVGQLYGGTAACSGSDPNSDPDYYGRFDISWDDDVSNWSKHLRPWLNPHGSSTSWISAMSGDEPCKASYFFQNVNDLHTSANVNGMNIPPVEPLPGTRSYNGVYMASGNIVTGASVTIQNGTFVEFQADRVILDLGFLAKAGSNFRAIPQPCLRGCSTGIGKRSEVSDKHVSDNYVRLNTDRINENFAPENTSYVSEGITLAPNPNTGQFNITFHVLVIISCLFFEQPLRKNMSV